ncbi:MAG: hypothetical protein CMJ39_03515 [Phycisphaerae bacterium]|nr:hypothetical protein [Phycisphaerae bacterium]|tara:strand:+ start:858 stop:1331 length:474 start_codon:yes stop_codon:yes gene_type:complete
MSFTHTLSIGFIPTDCDAPRIECGDPESFDGLEYTLIFCEESGILSCLENGKALEESYVIPEVVDAEAWQLACEEMLSDLDGIDKFFPGRSNAEVLDTVWKFFLDEPLDDVDYLKQIESECGEFNNPDGAFNGTTYCRYQLEEDDEYARDEVIIISN